MHKPSGLYVLKAYLNYYMLSKVSSYQISHLLTILVSAEQEAAWLPPGDGVHADREQPPLQHPHQDRGHQHPVIELAYLELFRGLLSWTHDIPGGSSWSCHCRNSSDNYLWIVETLSRGRRVTSQLQSEERSDLYNEFVAIYAGKNPLKRCFIVHSNIYLSFFR